MVGDFVGRDTEIERENWQIQRERGFNVPLSSLMLEKFKENVTKQSKERGKERGKEKICQKKNNFLFE